MQRPKWNSGSLESRSRLYWLTASSTVCFVSWFLSSKVMTGRPLMKIPISSAFGRLDFAVAKLPCDAEDIRRVPFFGRLVARCRHP